MAHCLIWTTASFVALPNMGHCLASTPRVIASPRRCVNVLDLRLCTLTLSHLPPARLGSSCSVRRMAAQTPRWPRGSWNARWLLKRARRAAALKSSGAGGSGVGTSQQAGRVYIFLATRMMVGDIPRPVLDMTLLTLLGANCTMRSSTGWRFRRLGSNGRASERGARGRLLMESSRVDHQTAGWRWLSLKLCTVFLRLRRSRVTAGWRWLSLGIATRVERIPGLILARKGGGRGR